MPRVSEVCSPTSSPDDQGEYLSHVQRQSTGRSLRVMGHAVPSLDGRVLALEDGTLLERQVSVDDLTCGAQLLDQVFWADEHVCV